MKDKEFINLLGHIRKELLRRYGKEMCSELHADCADCKVRYMIGFINSEVDLLEWKPNYKNK